MIFPVYEFRPRPGIFSQPPLRYAEGQWIADDGEYDICFIGSNSGDNYSLYFKPSYQKNIVCSWLTGHWTSNVKEHPHGNPWHYALREGETVWGGDWGSRNDPNCRAGDAGMSKISSAYGCANGRHVEMHADDKHIAAGLVRDRETKTTFHFPLDLRCMYCDAVAPVACEGIAA